jgi:hypothetical protein
MLAATSWTARLRSGLARTRAVLGSDLGVLFGRTFDRIVKYEK